MGLQDLNGMDNHGQNRAYNKHPEEEKFQDWLEELDSRFPDEIECAFVEISPRMTKYCAKAYYDREKNENYIRIAEKTVENQPEWYQKLVLLHEMVHIWFEQNGYGDVNDSDAIFNWVLGYVGADVSGTGPGHDYYENIIHRFFNHSSE